MMIPPEKSRPPLLHPSMIETPCAADWEAMSGDEMERRCDSCGKSVHHVSAMTPREIEELLGATRGSVCVRMRVRRDGSVSMASRLWEKWRAPRIRRLITKILGTLAIFAASACVRTGSVSRPDDCPKETSDTGDANGRTEPNHGHR